jgi:peroxisomal enoyl-CoA hydratase 2
MYAAERSMVIPGAPKLDPTRAVDGQQHITFLKPIPVTSAGKSFELRTKVIGIYDKGKAGAVLERETLLVETSSNEVYTKIVGSVFFVGCGNFGGRLL